MSLQPEELVSPQERFWEQDPTILREPDPFAPARTIDEAEVDRIGIGIAAAVVVLAVISRQHFASETPRTAQEVRESAKRVWNRVIPAWMRVAVPAVAQAYRLGSTGNVTYSEMEKMAADYAVDLGQYVTDSSTDALVEGFQAQINNGWSEELAWVRAREAYGLDSQQMRSYVKGLFRSDKTDYVTDPIPAASRMAVDRAFMIRADRLGSNEAYKATQVGKNMVWLSMEASDKLPAGTMKRWITAEDERVCPVCAPLDGVTVPLHSKFHSPEGSFYAPGVHPNCRCDIELVYPLEDIVKAMPGDPFDRDAKGRFAEREERKADSMFANRTRESMFAGREKERVDAKSAFFTKPQVSAAEAFRPSAAQALAGGKEKKKYTILYRPNEQGKMVPQTVELETEAVQRPHEYPVWMYASEFIDSPLSDFLGLDRAAIKKPGTIIDFSELSSPTSGEYQQMVHTDRENTPEDSELGSFAFEAAYNDAINIKGMELLSYRKAQERQYGKIGGDVAHYGKFGMWTSHKGPQMDEYRMTLAGMTRDELIRIIERVEMEDTYSAGYFDHNSDALRTTTVSADEVADEIMNAASLELMDAEAAMRGSGMPPRMVIAQQLNSLAMDVDTERVDRSRAFIDEDEHMDDVYLFKFNGWYGIEISQLDSRDPSGALSGKYRVVSHKETKPITDYTHKGAYVFPDEVANMKKVFDTVHIIELEPVMEPLQKALSNLSAFKGGMTHAGR